MLKAFSLPLGFRRLLCSRGPEWTPTSTRLFATTGNVSFPVALRPTASRMCKKGQSDDPDLPQDTAPEAECNERQKPTRGSTERTEWLEREGSPGIRSENGENMFPPKLRSQTNKAALENAGEGLNWPHRYNDLEEQAAEKGQQQTRRSGKTRGQDSLLEELNERVARSDQQDFHAQLDPALHHNIMLDCRVRRGMPVFDTTFSTVKSGKNLFIQTSLSDRSLQYMLPITQTFLESQVSRRQARHTFMLVLCPTFSDVNTVRDTGILLSKRCSTEIKMSIMVEFSPMQAKKIHRQGCDALICTPEALLQWLALRHVGEPLRDMLQALQILVVDGQARSLRDINFLECLRAVTEIFPVIGGQSKIQRVVVSDDHDPQLDELLKKLVLPGDHELLHDEQLERVQELREAHVATRRRLMRRRRREGREQTSRNIVDPSVESTKHQNRDNDHEPGQRRETTDLT